MKVGDLVKVIVTNPTSRDPDTGVVVGTLEYGKAPHYAKVALHNGYIATYRFDNLEVLSASR